MVGQAGANHAPGATGRGGPLAGEIRAAQIFVAVLGVSSYPFVEATWTQGLPN
ncbi:hypothetical protein DFAR_2300011 [Desulfarculales bacterium]